MGSGKVATPCDRMHLEKLTPSWSICATEGWPAEADDRPELREFEPQAAITVAARIADRAIARREVVRNMTQVVPSGRSHQCNTTQPPAAIGSVMAL